MVGIKFENNLRIYEADMKKMKLIAVLLLVISLSLFTTSCLNSNIDNSDGGETNPPDGTVADGGTEEGSDNTEGSGNPTDDKDTDIDVNISVGGGIGSGDTDGSGNTEDSGNTDGGADNQKPTGSIPEIDYVTYVNLSQEEQLEIFNSFENIQDFFDWFNEIKEEYEADHPGIDIGDGNIDIGDLIKP